MQYYSVFLSRYSKVQEFILHPAEHYQHYLEHYNYGLLWSITESIISHITEHYPPTPTERLGAHEPQAYRVHAPVVNTVRAASHPPVWIHRKCELRSLKKTLSGLCRDDDYTIAQWLGHRWLQARVPGSSPGGDSQLFFLQTFPVCLFPSNQLIFYDLGLPAYAC